MYEVLKFIEHGTQCRQSMDSERGELLICRLRQNRRLEKEVLFDWFRQIGVSLDQFHRCRKGQRYRYLNPYSIVAAENGRVYLLDLEAAENEPVIKKMQNQTVKKHFVKPVYGAGSDFEGDVDLFGYGRTMQFVLAYITVVPRLSRKEEKKLARIISRCTEFSKKGYSDVRQAAGDIPTGRGRPLPERTRRKIFAGAAGCLGVLAALSLILTGTEGEPSSPAVGGKAEEVNAQSGKEREDLLPEDGGQLTNEEYIAGAGQILRDCLLENTVQGNEEALLLGKEMELAAVRSLAAAYERQDMTDEAVLAYGRLLEIEEGTVQIEDAAQKKMKLEAHRGQYAQAVLTGEEALKKVEDSEKLRQLIEEYRALQNGQEDGTDAWQTEKDLSAEGPKAGEGKTDEKEE